MYKEKILITGAAGFIGFHLINKLSESNFEIVGIDNLNDYYDVDLKKSRLDLLKDNNNFVFYKMDISDKKLLDKLFSSNKFDYVINLAAQAGVRYSITNPDQYISSNVIGYYNILEMCRKYPVKHLLYASSSSVYGGNEKIPFSESDSVDKPVSLYAATKKTNELMAYTYSHLYDIPTTGMRFFTVYGPYGRPDMAYFSFTKNIINGNPIKVYNQGKMKRDFTYVDDIVIAIQKLILCPPEKDIRPAYRILNIGNSTPVSLEVFIDTIEKYCKKKAKKEYVGMQAGDVTKTYADISQINDLIGYSPDTSIEYGVAKFVEWYKETYNEE